jgi:hypothetical protein
MRGSGSLSVAQALLPVRFSLRHSPMTLASTTGRTSRSPTFCRAAVNFKTVLKPHLMKDFGAVQLEVLAFLSRQVVTTMLSSVVAVTENSPRARQSAQTKGLVRHGLLATALPSRHHLLTRHPPLTPGFLIANPELEFPASCCKQRSEAFSNRKFSAALRSPQRILTAALPGEPGTVLIVPFFSPSLQPQALSLQNFWPPSAGRLIETPRLEFRVTPTKQTSEPLSNRYKNALFNVLILPSPPSFQPSELSYNELTQTGFL